jgi:hypothetical protein
VTSAYRANRKTTDEDIIRLNSVGLSLSTIAKQLDCHPTTITLRLRDLNIPPADTRRAFMESIYMQMSPRQREWLENQLGPTINIKDFVLNLITEKYISERNPGDPK